MLSLDLVSFEPWNAFLFFTLPNSSWTPLPPKLACFAETKGDLFLSFGPFDLSMFACLFGWRLTCAHNIRLTCAHSLFYIVNSPAHTGFASAAHTSITFFFKHPMLPQTQLHTQDSPHLRAHKLSHDLLLPIASTVPRHTDALRLIDDVGLGWGVGGVEGGGGVLITSLWTFICMMISFCSLLPQYHVTQMLCV